MKVSNNRNDDKYEVFLGTVKNNFEKITKDNTPLFRTNSSDLFDVFLDNLPSQTRQHYTCNSCKHFVNRFGGLVTISDNGTVKSALWDISDVPEFFAKSVKALKDIVVNLTVSDVFKSSDRVLGFPVTGEWEHLSARLPVSMVYTSMLKTAGQSMAESKEDFKMLLNSVLKYSIETIDSAVILLNSEALYRSDKCLGVANWFKDLKTVYSKAKTNKAKANIIWLAVAKAPVGFCHISSSMIGTLLDDINDGLSADAISRRFAEKMSPSNYMRAQAAPTVGNIQQAEKIVQQLGIVDSLKRRYAKFDEIPNFMWLNKKVDKTITKDGSVFGNVIPKGKKETEVMEVPSTVMTWDKFQRTVLPTADSIEVKIDNPNRFMALVTASDLSAENILQWDNTFSWYYHGGVDGEIKRRVENAGGRYENNEIRCSLIWEGPTDLDIHCITPDGYHIYYASKTYGNGYLDVDANGGHVTSYEPVENIRWSNRAPVGNYKFYVHNYCERGNGSTPYKVELEINGRIYTYNGVASRTGYKEDIFSFNYITGVQPNIRNINSYPSTNSWNVENGFVKVNGITNSPNLWGDKPVEHSGNHIFFILDKCKDLSEGKGRGFFNEMLKSELREVRKTLEAYMANTPIEDSENASACGVGYSKDSEWNLLVNVVSNNSKRLIKIDRWD